MKLHKHQRYIIQYDPRERISPIPPIIWNSVESVRYRSKINHLYRQYNKVKNNTIRYLILLDIIRFYNSITHEIE